MGCEMWGVGCRVSGVECEVWGVGCGVCGGRSDHRLCADAGGRAEHPTPSSRNPAPWHPLPEPWTSNPKPCTLNLVQTGEVTTFVVGEVTIAFVQTRVAK